MAGSVYVVVVFTRKSDFWCKMTEFRCLAGKCERLVGRGGSRPAAEAVVPAFPSGWSSFYTTIFFINSLK